MLGKVVGSLSPAMLIAVMLTVYEMLCARVTFHGGEETRFVRG